MERQTLRAALLVAAAALASAPASSAPRGVQDAVVVENGDTFRGEIKSLTRGTLRFDTDSAGVIPIDWADVLSITSPSRFRVEMSDGTTYYAALVPAPEERKVALDAERGAFVVDAMDIVRISEIEESFWDKSSGYLSAGFSYTKSSDISQLSLSAGLGYTERDWKASLDLNLINTTQADAPTAKKNDLKGKYTRFLGNRWFAYGQLLFEQNSELGLDLRTSLTAAAGRFLVQSNSQLLAAQLGVGLEQENPSGAEPGDENVTALIGSNYDLFITESPTTALTLALYLIPYLSNTSRFRMNFDTGLRKEIISDFFWDLTFYARYDNEPPNPDASTSDWGVVTSFGYSF